MTDVEQEIDSRDLETRFYSFRLADLLRLRDHVNKHEWPAVSDYEGIPVGPGLIRDKDDYGVEVRGLLFGVNWGITFTYTWLARHGFREYALAILDSHDHMLQEPRME